MKHILFLFSRFDGADILDIVSNFMINTSCTTTSISAADTRKCEATLKIVFSLGQNMLKITRICFILYQMFYKP